MITGAQRAASNNDRDRAIGTATMHIQSVGAIAEMTIHFVIPSCSAVDGP